MREIYNFSENQLKVLLLGNGYSGALGFELDGADLDNESALSALNELSNKGYIVSDGKSFTADEAVRRIVGTIGSAASCLAVRTRVESLPDLCVYMSELPLVCYRRSGSGNISAYYSEVDDLITDLIDEGYFAPETEPIALDTDEILNFERNRVFLPSPELADESVTFSVEKTGSKSVLCAVDYFFCKYIRYEENGSISRELCSRENMKEYFMRLLEE